MKNKEFKEMLRRAAAENLLKEIPQEAPEHEFPENFDTELKEKLHKKIAEEQKHTKKVICRAASIVVVAAATLTLMSISVRAFFPQIWRVFVDWFEDYSSVSFNVERGEKSSALGEIMEPKYLPEGVEVGDVYDTVETHAVEYIANKNVIIRFSQELSLDEAALIDNSYVFESITINGYAGYIGTNETTHVITWDDGIYRFRLVLNIDAISDEVAIKMAESVYKN